MPCYHPISAYRLLTASGKPDAGQRSLRFKTPVHPTTKHVMAHEELKVPCGQCIGCRFEHARDWATRLALEANVHGGNSCFVTLTYDPEHVPSDGGLDLRDAQLFLKRLRFMYYQETKKTLRYYLCGEYGERFARPHYHIMLFGCDFRDGSINGPSRSGFPTWTHPMIDKAWGMGRTEIGSASGGACTYVAGYVLKKINPPTIFGGALPHNSEYVEASDETKALLKGGDIHVQRRTSFDLISPQARALAELCVGAYKNHSGYGFTEPLHLDELGGPVIGQSQFTPPPELADWLRQFPRTTRDGKFKSSRTDEDISAISRYFRWDSKTGHPTLVAPEWSTMSRRPGIADAFRVKYADQILANKFVMPTLGGPKRPIPAQFFRKYAEMTQYSDMVEEIKADRRVAVIKAIADRPEEYTPERLAQKKLFVKERLKASSKRKEI